MGKKKFNAAGRADNDWYARYEDGSDWRDENQGLHSNNNNRNQAGNVQSHNVQRANNSSSNHHANNSSTAHYCI